MRLEPGRTYCAIGPVANPEKKIAPLVLEVTGAPVDGFYPVAKVAGSPSPPAKVIRVGCERFWREVSPETLAV